MFAGDACPAAAPFCFAPFGFPRVRVLVLTVVVFGEPLPVDNDCPLCVPAGFFPPFG
ncbi:MAG TPA: hypothetical protein VM694_22120 [Polyangium sp.]|nr:hypothetical protein [Polyangium sp.]